MSFSLPSSSTFLSFNILVVSPCNSGSFAAVAVTSTDSSSTIYTTFDAISATSTIYSIKDGTTKVINFTESVGTVDTYASPSINICGTKSYSINTCSDGITCASPVV